MNQRCYHCGEAVSPSSHYQLLIDGELRPMCCPACVAVAQCIQGAGLEDYYRLRSQLPDTPDANPADYQLYDNDRVLASFSEFEGTTTLSRLSLSGLHCAACAWLIEHQLSRLDGVEEVHVHLQNAVASVRWQPEKIRMSRIMTAVQELGYQALPDSANNRQLQLQQELDTTLRRLGLAGIGMMQVGMVAIGLYAGDFQGIDTTTRDLLRYFSLAVATPVLLYSAQPFFSGAWRSVRSRQPGMDVPVSLALICAYIASALATVRGWEHVYFDTISMFTFFLLLSRYLQARIRQRELGQQQLIPLAARRLDKPGDSHFRWLPSAELQAGDRVLVPPGEVIPADGTVASGHSSVETSAFNGEFLPQQVGPGSPVLAGSGNIDTSLEICISNTVQDSSLGKMDRLLEQAQSAKPQFALLADRLASYFVVLVIALAGLSYALWHQFAPDQAFVTALAVLVVSCPCALSLATPTTFTAAVRALQKSGILLRNAQVLEKLQYFDTVLFDKTGTLTLGRPTITATEWLCTDGAAGETELRRIAAALEQDSSHPLAKAFSLHGELPAVANRQLTAGQGIEGLINGLRYRIGKASYCAELCPPLTTPLAASDAAPPATASEVLLVNEQGPLARFWLDDQLRPQAHNLVEQLQQRGCELHLLSGDRPQAVAQLAETLGIDQQFSRCSAADKLAHIQQLQGRGNTVMMIGDGVNDAPVIAAADISIAMSAASDLTRNQADVILLNESLDSVLHLLTQARRSRRILRQNIGWALAYNCCALPLAALGMVPPWLAAIGMSASSLLVVLNALRIGSTASTARPRSGALPLPVQEPS